MQGKPLLSIVVTSYSSERLGDVLELLDGIAGQEYENIETVFIAERCLEIMGRVREYANQRTIRNVLAVFKHGGPGLSAARNLGIGNAKGDIIAFVDDDVVLPSDWAGQMVKAHNDDSIIGVTGTAVPLWESESMNRFPQQFYWILSCTAWRKFCLTTLVLSLVALS